MMETHPGELELLSYVEGELGDAEARALGEHAAACPACRERIRELETGRDALRDSALLHLPPRRRDAILADLPRREPARGGFASTKRALAILTPVAAVAVVVLALANVSGDGRVGGGAGGGGEAAATTAAYEAQGEAAEGGAADSAAEPEDQMQTQMNAPLERKALRQVAGPPEEVARFLRRNGYDARVADGDVFVRTDTPAKLRRLLATLPPGNVHVLVE